MAVDIARLDAALAHIEAHPKEWDQRFWIRRTECGTACCLAGTVALLAGWTPSGWNGGLDYLTDTEITSRVRRVKDGIEQERRVEDVAAELLGVDGDGRDSLFHFGNNLADLKRIRDELAAQGGGSDE